MDRSTWVRELLLGALLLLLLVLAYLVLEQFFLPLAWAAILVYATWPLHSRIQQALRGRATLSAVVMTLVLIAAIVLPALWVANALHAELSAAYDRLLARLAAGQRLPEALANIPWLGETLDELFEQLAADPAALRAQISRWAQQTSAALLALVGQAGRNVLVLVLTLLTAFFFYRDGERLVGYLQQTLARLLGARAGTYLDATADMIRAVVYGLLLTALAQGLLAGLGYWVAGLTAPILLALVTALAALLPFGTPFVWVPAGGWLLLNGHVLAGIGLLLWGTFVVSSVDNLVRPLVISRATHIPFLLVMFGVLGGLFAFGFVGVFVGPVILAVLIAVWREWVTEHEAGHGPGPGS